MQEAKFVRNLWLFVKHLQEIQHHLNIILITFVLIRYIFWTWQWFIFHVSSNLSFLSVYFKYFIFWFNHSLLEKRWLLILTFHFNVCYWTSYINYVIQNILPLQMTRVDFKKHLSSHLPLTSCQSVYITVNNLLY